MQPVRNDVTHDRTVRDGAKSRSRRRLLFRLSIALGIVIATLLALYCFRRPILVEIARVLVIDDPPVQSDYIVVLGGDPNSRPFLAADLYKKGFAPRILIFQSKTDRLIESGMAMSEDQVYRKVMEAEGVPSEAIERLPGIDDSTEDESRSVSRLLASRPATRIIVVTSAEHTRRARWIFRRTFSGTPTEIRMAAARNPWYDETNWWQDDSGAIAVAHEYLKFPYYVYRY